MARENSFSDSDGRSLTPDLDEVPDPAFTGPSSPDAPSHARDESTLVQRAKTHHSSLRPKIITEVENYSFLNRAKTHQSTPKSRPNGDKTDRTNKINFVETVSAPSALPTVNSPSTPKVNYVPGAAKSRFKDSVRKIILSRRTSTALYGVGAEPGIDPRRSSAYVHYGHIKDRCTVDIVDYSSLRSSFGKMENRGFVEFCENETASAREPWVRVRWINIGGISWDVMSALALKYDIHPLALEDVLHQRSTQSRSKADYYNKHLFIRVLRHRYAPDDDEFDRSIFRPFATGHPSNNNITGLPRSASPTGFEEDERDCSDEEDTKYGGSPSASKFSTKRKGMGKSGLMKLAYEASRQDLEKGPGMPTGSSGLTGRKYAANALAVERLKKGDRVNVQISPMFLLLFRDGTVITITSKPDPDFTAPIIARLRQRDTVLRQTADPSLLVQSLLDLVVDQALEVVDEYQKKILKLEHDILIRPQVKTVRYLHILSADLTSNKRTLEPIKTLVYGLRRYDVDRCAALLDSASTSKAETSAVEGFMSHKAKIYLADVHDHMDYILSSMDMFSSVAENLISYTFNMASYEMNQVMQRLTTATIIFLPLTLLTGYFGMNFEAMWSVQQNTDVLFWIIALPVMAIIVPLFMWSDILRLVHYCRKRWALRTLEARVKKSQ